MKIQIKSVHFDADVRLEDHIHTKVNKLTTFYTDIIGVEVFLKAEKVAIVDNKVVTIKLEIPGNDLVAEKQAKTFEEATDLATEALQKQLKKYKDKKIGH